MIEMNGGRTKLIRITSLVAAAMLIIAAVFGFCWYKGMFLPRWIKWENVAFNMADDSLVVDVNDKHITVMDADGNFVWELNPKCLVQSALRADVDGDGQDDLLVLCWRIGRYGKRKPFWVKHDELKWSQHIYAYNTYGGEITQKWLASDIGQQVMEWEVCNDKLLINTTPEGFKSTWAWISWGFERIPDDAVDLYSQKKMERIPEPQDNNGSESEKVDVIMVGDILLHNGVVASCQNGEEFDFSPLFENTADVISDADIAIVNQEIILGGTELGITGYPSFNAPYEVGDALVEAGFDVVCHGTNHALDRGKKGIINSLTFWKEKYPDIAVLGINETLDEYEDVYITENDGIKIAILNYTYGTNGIPMPGDMPFAVDLLDKEKIAKDLEYAEENADFTIVCPHWGIEYQLKQCADQEKWAKFMTEKGADLILGTHPHVIEPMEWIETENGNKALCFYSLGNFINWTSGRGQNVANRMVGGMAKVSIVKKADETAQISEYDVIPLVSHVEHERGKVTTYLLENYSEELAENNAIREQDASFSYEYCVELSEKIWGEE